MAVEQGRRGGNAGAAVAAGDGAADEGARRAVGGRRRRGAVAELDQRLEVAGVRQRQDPEEFHAAAALVHVDFDGLLLLLADLPLVALELAGEVEDAVALDAEGPALGAHDLGARFAVVVVGTQRLKSTSNWELKLIV